MKTSLIESFGKLNSPFWDIDCIFINSKFNIFLFPLNFDRMAMIYIKFFHSLNIR